MRKTGRPFATKLVLFPCLQILAADVAGRGPDGEALVGGRSGFRRAYFKFGLRSGENRTQLAGGEGVQLAEAVRKFSGG